MNRQLPALGVRFDIKKIPSSNYGFESWKLLWRTLRPEDIRNVALFEGDTSGSLKGLEEVFCIVLQASDERVLRRAKESLARSRGFLAACAAVKFVEGTKALAEPLASAGAVDGAGNLVGSAGASRSALGAVRKERQARNAPRRPVAAGGARTKSRRTAGLPPIASLTELESLLKEKFCPDPERAFWYYLTPEELCDVVDHCKGFVEVHYARDSCGLSEDMVYVTLFGKVEHGLNLEFTGLFAFASAADAQQYCRKNGILPAVWGIQGKHAAYFQGNSGNYVSESSYAKRKENCIPPEQLWERICARRLELGLRSGPSSKLRGCRVTGIALIAAGVSTIPAFLKR